MKDSAVPSLAASPLSRLPASGATGYDATLIDTARAFEAVFVAQMLTYSGLAKALSAEGGFGGEAFSGLLVEQYADRIVEKGGFGLAEKVYEQLSERGGANGGRTGA